jgi:hypothetical protein
MPKNSYDKALDNFADPTNKIKIKQTLDRWSTGSQKGHTIVQNLVRLEKFLRTECMYKILCRVRDNHLSDLETLLIEYKDECTKHTGKGGNVHSSITPRLVGKAIDRVYFYKWLRKNYKSLFKNQKQADYFIDKLLAGHPLTSAQRAIYLGSKYQIWVTWSSINPSADPFDFIKYGMAEEALANLGLEPNRKRKKHLILLVYTRPRELLRPTIADAGIFTFFQPAPPEEEKHGLTKPWEESFLSVAIKKKDEDYKPQPRPEAVHAASIANLSLIMDTKQLL